MVKELDKYQELAASFIAYKKEHNVYPLYGLASEIGEIFGLYARIERGDITDKEAFEPMIKELGDVLWNLSTLCYEMGVPLSKVATLNIEKLTDRKKRGVIKGRGDDR